MQPIEKNYKELSLDPRAYRFFPTKTQEKSSFDKKGSRFFFYGQITHDEYEQRKLKEFYQYVANKKLQYNKQLFNEQKVLLFLSGNSYKPDKTIEALKGHQQFRKDYLPSVATPQIQALLKKGFFYPCGRDFHFRPVCVYNAKLIDWKNVDLCLRATIYLHERLIEKIFIPGQVETWIIIYDLGNMGVSDIPINVIKNVLGIIGQNYGGRLYKLYMVNAPSSVWFTWKIVSAFLDPITVDKIIISKTNTEKKMWSIMGQSQVQQKYGGKQPDRKQFWPFTIPEAQIDQKRLISDEEYEKKLKNGELKLNQIDPKFK